MLYIKNREVVTVRRIHQIISVAFLSIVVAIGGCNSRNSTQGNVIFIHPDGTSPSHWGAARMLNYGPDGRLNWDKMSHQAVYLGHMKNFGGW